MPYYIPDLVSKTTCIGNTLSTFNISFSTLDTKTFELSTSVNYLSSTMISVSSTLNNRVNFLSSSIISVSSDLRTQIFNTSSDIITQLNFASSYSTTQEAFLSSSVNYVSSNVISDYIGQGTLQCPSDGNDIVWTIAEHGNNVSVTITANVGLPDPIGLYAGQTGNVIAQIGIATKSVTSFGDSWIFYNALSSMSVDLSSKNVISYYYDGEHILASLISYDIPVVP